MWNSIEEMVVATSAMVRPPERLSVSEAAAKYRVLNNPGSYVGPWNNNKAPYLVEPMDTLTSLDFTGVIFAGPARSGKSDLFINWMTHTAICDPADMLLVHMTKAAGADYSERDINRAFRHSREVGSRLLPGKQNNNVHDKRFSSGMNVLIRWPSITELSGKTVPRVWIMDYDRIDDDIDGEGPAFQLGQKRTESFRRFGMTVAESSPGREIQNPNWIRTTDHEAPPVSGILGLYNQGDRRRWFWRCPQCHEAFEPTFETLTWDNSIKDHGQASRTVVMACPHDGYPIQPSMKSELNIGGRWIKEGMKWNADGSITGTPRQSKIASFWMFGPSAVFQTWESLVYNYLMAQEHFERTGDEGPLKKTVNTDQGNAYKPKKMESSRLPEELKSRKEDWGGAKDEPVVPASVRFLVATIDVQARSFVVQVHGVGAGGDIYIIDMFKIRRADRIDEHDKNGERATIDPAAYAEDWNVLIEQVIERTYPLADDPTRVMAIKITGCDSGGREGVTVNAYNFWRALRDDYLGRGHHRRFHLIKGDPTPTAPRRRMGYPDSNRRDRNSGARGDVPVEFFSPNLLKDQLAGMLGRTVPGGAMIHFPYWAENWLFTQLTNEVRTAKGWENKAQRRNEAWDLAYYCLGLCLHPSIKLEHIDWGNPPSWAKEWEHNDLVVKIATMSVNPIVQTKKAVRSLAEIAASVA
jgi:phage terminase large subunit GpA-like protein